MKSQYLVLVVILTISLILSGCGDKNSTSSAPTERPPASKSQPELPPSGDYSGMVVAGDPMVWYHDGKGGSFTVPVTLDSATALRYFKDQAKIVIALYQQGYYKEDFNQRNHVPEAAQLILDADIRVDQPTFEVTAPGQWPYDKEHHKLINPLFVHRLPDQPFFLVNGQRVTSEKLSLYFNFEKQVFTLDFPISPRFFLEALAEDLSAWYETEYSPVAQPPAA